MALFGQAAALHRKVTGSDHPCWRGPWSARPPLIDQGGRAKRCRSWTSAWRSTARYGNEHPAVATAVGALCRGKAVQGDDKEAERLFREASTSSAACGRSPTSRPRRCLRTGQVLVREQRAPERAASREALSQAAAALLSPIFVAGRSRPRSGPA
jgi:hypothetical protein